MGLHVVVLAGGSGTRLWPLSRAAVPKHLLPLATSGRTLLRATIERVLPLGAQVWVVTVAAQAESCAAELSAAGAKGGGVIAEPAARGTGPALGLAVRCIAGDDAEAVICSVHADHHVGDDEGYRRALRAAAGWAAVRDGLATVGAVALSAATGLGYIALGEPLDPSGWRPPPGSESPSPADAGAAGDAFIAEAFVEKPPRAVAEDFVAGGGHLWNTGLFAWTAAAFLRELEAASAEIAAGVAAAAEGRAGGDEGAVAAAYLALPSIAVDPLIMERTSSLVAVRAAFGWSDVGSWADLLEARRAGSDADAAGNLAAGDALLAGASGCYVDARGGRLVAVVGAQGVVVVDTGDAVLVLDAGRAQDVRAVVEELRRRGRSELL